MGVLWEWDYGYFISEYQGMVFFQTLRSLLHVFAKSKLIKGMWTKGREKVFSDIDQGTVEHEQC